MSHKARLARIARNRPAPKYDNPYANASPEELYALCERIAAQPTGFAELDAMCRRVVRNHVTNHQPQQGD